VTDIFDPDKLVAEFVRTNMDAFLTATGSGIKGGRDPVRIQLRTTYEPYVSSESWNSIPRKSESLCRRNQFRTMSGGLWSLVGGPEGARSHWAADA